MTIVFIMCHWTLLGCFDLASPLLEVKVMLFQGAKLLAFWATQKPCRKA